MMPSTKMMTWMLILIDRVSFICNNVTPACWNGKVFQFVTDDKSKEHEYLYCHENNKLYWLHYDDKSM